MAVVFEERKGIDSKTGEVVAESVVVSRFRDDEPDYVKLYIDAWCAFKQVKSINTSFLYQLLPSTTYAGEGQYIFVNAALKRDIGQRLNWSAKTAVNRASGELTKLCSAGVLRKVENGKYQVNPELIGKGSWRDVRKLRATFNLEDGSVSHAYAV